MVNIAALQAISAALCHGSLQNIKEVALEACDSDDGVFKNFMGALEESGCAKRLMVLSIGFSSICTEEVRVLADLLCRDALPALEDLSLHGNGGIKDVGVVALAEALEKSTKTFLLNLDLTQVGMADEGLAALSSLIYRGRLEKLQLLRITQNHAITDRGVIALARAVETRGLPMLEYLHVELLTGVTAAGYSAMAHAAVKGCARLRLLGLEPEQKQIILPWSRAFSWQRDER